MQLEWLFSNGYQRFDYETDNTMDVVILPVAQEVISATHDKSSWERE